MKNYLIISILFLLSLSSCDLNQKTCVCSNPGGEFETIKVSKNKKEAEVECQAHYDANYNFPWSEVYCEVR